MNKPESILQPKISNSLSSFYIWPLFLLISTGCSPLKSCLEEGNAEDCRKVLQDCREDCNKDLTWYCVDDDKVPACKQFHGDDVKNAIRILCERGNDENACIETRQGHMLKVAHIKEAKSNLALIAAGALAYYETEHALDAAGMNLSTHVYPNCGGSGCKAGIGNPASKETIGTNHIADFNVSPWKELHFMKSSPFYYYYYYVSNDGGPGESSFTVTASASIDSECDSIYEIKGYRDGTISEIVDVSNDKSKCNTASQ